MIAHRRASVVKQVLNILAQKTILALVVMSLMGIANCGGKEAVPFQSPGQQKVQAQRMGLMTNEGRNGTFASLMKFYTTKNRHQTSPFDNMVYAENHDLLTGRLGQALRRAYILGAHDEVVNGMIGEQVRSAQVKEMLGQLPPFRKPRLHQGEIILGRDMDGDAVQVPLAWSKAGVLLVANTGGGKSTLIWFLMPQFANQHCKFWIFESSKQEARRLMRVLRRMGLDLIVIRARDLKYNLFQAGRCDVRVHLLNVVDLLDRRLQFPPRGRAIVWQLCHDLYTQFGIWNGNATAWPTPFDLYEKVHSTPGLNMPARDGILDRLGAFLVSLTPQCGAYRMAWDPLSLQAHSIVYEFRDASETVKQLTIEPWLYTVMHAEYQQGASNVPLSLSIVIEDCQRYFEGNTQGSDLTPLDQLAGLIRGGGKALFGSCQTMQGLSHRLIPNLATKIMGRLGAHGDYMSLGADMGMTQQQIEWAQRNLVPGQFIGQVAEGQWREPFLFRAPLIRLGNAVSNDEAFDSLRALAHLPVVPAEEFAHWQPHHIIEVAKTEPQVPRGSNLTEIDLRFLKAVVHEPAKPSSYYAKRAGLSGQRAAEIRKRLVEQGFLREHSVATGQRGRTAIVLEPLVPAFTAGNASSEGHA